MLRWTVRIGGLAAVLAGLLAAAVDHLGTMSAESDPHQIVKIWQRPADLTALLDAWPDLAARVGLAADTGQVAVMGFSLGGHSALSLSGLRESKARIIAYCDRFPDKVDCGWFKKNAVDFEAIDQALYEQSNKDPRVVATIAVDPTLPLAMKDQSLPDLDHPALLNDMGAPEGIPNGMRVDGLAGALAQARYHTVPDAWHFSAMTTCSAFGRLMIGLAGEDNIYAEQGARTREDIHAELTGVIGPRPKSQGLGAS